VRRRRKPAGRQRLAPIELALKLRAVIGGAVLSAKLFPKGDALGIAGIDARYGIATAQGPCRTDRDNHHADGNNEVSEKGPERSP